MAVKDCIATVYNFKDSNATVFLTTCLHRDRIATVFIQSSNSSPGTLIKYLFTYKIYVPGEEGEIIVISTIGG